MKNLFIKWPKRVAQICENWKSQDKKNNVIRASFNVNLYLDYLNAIQEQPKTFQS